MTCQFQIKHKERRRNNFRVKVLRFRLDLVDLIEQSHRNSKLFRGLVVATSVNLHNCSLFISCFDLQSK
jgi:hypothetical protein